MKSKLFFFLLSLCISNTCLAQEDKPKFERYKELLGIWKLETIENEKTPVILIIEFKKNGSFDLKSQFGLEIGTYFPSADKKSIKMVSKKGEELWEIKKIDNKEFKIFDANPRNMLTYVFSRIKKAEANLILPEKQ